MKIPKNLKSFPGETALIIVASPAHAEFYRGFEDNLVKSESFRVSKPEFSDQKSYLSTTSRGRDWKVATSSVEQLVKRDIYQRFAKRFKEYIKSLSGKYDFSEIYIFCPDYFEPELEKLIPANLKKKRKAVLNGNYHKIKPLDLLKKLGPNPKKTNRNMSKPEKSKTAEVVLKRSKASKRIEKKVTKKNHHRIAK